MILGCCWLGDGSDEQQIYGTHMLWEKSSNPLRSLRFCKFPGLNPAVSGGFGVIFWCHLASRSSGIVLAPAAACSQPCLHPWGFLGREQTPKHPLGSYGLAGVFA